MVAKALLTSDRGDWQTPDDFLERVRKVLPIGLDPCTCDENPTGARHFFTPFHDGLAYEWWVPEEELVYVNPPYGRGIDKWVRKCWETSQIGHTVIALLPARTDTRWFPWHADMLCFWRGRIKFRGAKHPAPFPSLVALWSPYQYVRGRFSLAFLSAGTMVYPGAKS